MNHKISIKNLGPLKNIENFEVKKINILIGESAVGKSVLAKAVYLFNDLYFLEALFFQEIKDSPIRNKREIILKNYFDIFFSDKYKRYSITYFYTENLHLTIGKKEINFEVTYSEDLEKLLDKTEKEIKDVRNAREFKTAYEKIFEFLKNEEMKKETEDFAIEISSEKENILPKQKYNDLIENASKIFKEVTIKTPNEIKDDFLKKLNILPILFIPATRSFVSDFDDLILRRLDRRMEMYGRHYQNEHTDITLVDFSNVYRRFIKRFEVLDKHKELIKGQVQRINRKISFFVENQELDISELSSGQKELFPILMILQQIEKTKEPHFLIIEEPEAHLFPKDQRRIFDELVAVINKTNSKLLITTHSPYMLMSANNLIAAKEKKYEKLKNKYIDFKNDIQTLKLADGEGKSLLDEKTHLIDGDFIEKVVDEVVQEYEDILNDGADE